MALPFRFFVSFSSRDLKFVREIMATLKGQGIDFWDYSDIAESIEVGENIDVRLGKEIDRCTHMVVVISENSLDATIGRFCRFELEYALNRKSAGLPQFIPVLIESHDKLKLESPYDIFEKDFCSELDESAESIVKLTVKICQLIQKTYLPPFEAHSNLPFWKLFRTEVEEMAHSNNVHVDIMMILGEFNEFYRRSDMQNALLRIDYFLMTCAIKVQNYHPFYPRIVKAVCETELGMYNEALKSYEMAKAIQPENQDVIGGIGTVYFKTCQYPQAAACFEQIIRNNTNEDVTNARINLIITKQATDKPVSIEEEQFLFKVDINKYPDDLKTAILNAQGIQYKIKRDYAALERHCKSVISKNLHDAITLRLLEISYISRGMKSDSG
jgi:tetratricopeptide (TPR) repeat protein